LLSEGCVCYLFRRKPNRVGFRCTDNMTGHIQNDRELEFAVFCIENVAEALGKPSGEVYRALAGPDGILNQYIVPSYDVLHTQGKEYIVDDILRVMDEKGVAP